MRDQYAAGSHSRCSSPSADSSLHFVDGGLPPPASCYPACLVNHAAVPQLLPHGAITSDWPKLRCHGKLSPCCVADLHHRLTSALHLQQSMLLGLPQFLNWSVSKVRSFLC
ncbi:hypothetical protein V8C44DRAFT_351355 [Trichoderma aethiopicum]